jgi:hypothetical protein
MVGISVGLVREYGAALFLGAPTISAFTATLLFGRIHGPNAGFSFVAAMICVRSSSTESPSFRDSEARARRV